MRWIGRLVVFACLSAWAHGAAAEAFVARPSNPALPPVTIEVGIRGHDPVSGFVSPSIAPDAAAFDGFISVSVKSGTRHDVRVRRGAPLPPMPLVPMWWGRNSVRVSWFDPSQQLLSEADLSIDRESLPDLRAVIVSPDPAFSSYENDGAVGLSPAQFARYAPALNEGLPVALDLRAWPLLQVATRERLATMSRLVFFGAAPPPGYADDWLLREMLPARYDGRWAAREYATETKLGGTPVFSLGPGILVADYLEPAAIVGAFQFNLKRIGSLPSYSGFSWILARRGAELRYLRLLAFLLVPLVGVLALRSRRRAVVAAGVLLLAGTLVAAFAWPPRRAGGLEVVSTRSDSELLVRASSMTTHTFASKLELPRDAAGRREFRSELMQSQELVRQEFGDRVVFSSRSPGPLMVTPVDLRVERRQFDVPVASISDHVLRLPASQFDRPEFAEAVWECDDHYHHSSGPRRKDDEFLFRPSDTASHSPARLELLLRQERLTLRPLADRATYWVKVFSRTTGGTGAIELTGPIGTASIARYWFDNPRLANGVATVGAIPPNGWPADGEVAVAVQIAAEAAPAPAVTLRGSLGELTLATEKRPQSSYWDAGWEFGCPPAPTRFAAAPAAAVRRLLAAGERLTVSVAPADGPCEHVVVTMRRAKKGDA